LNSLGSGWGTGQAWRIREGWLDETRSAYLYGVMAEIERGSPRSSFSSN